MGSGDYLVVDMDRVLNESEHGRAGLESMQALLRRARSDAEALKADLLKAQGAGAQREAREALLEHRRRVERELDKRRGALREALVKLAVKVTRDIAAARGVELVLEKRAAVVFDQDKEVTEAVIERVDASRLASRPRPSKRDPA